MRGGLAQTIDPELRAPTLPSEGASTPAPAPIPLVVDLDGTLIRSDLLVESVLALWPASDPPGAL